MGVISFEADFGGSAGGASRCGWTCSSLRGASAGVLDTDWTPIFALLSKCLMSHGLQRKRVAYGRRRTAISLFGSFTSNRQTASAIAASTSVASTVPSHFLAGVERTT
jgi:hypothetical protein